MACRLALDWLPLVNATKTLAYICRESVVSDSSETELQSEPSRNNAEYPPLTRGQKIRLVLGYFLALYLLAIITVLPRSQFVPTGLWPNFMVEWYKRDFINTQMDNPTEVHDLYTRWFGPTGIFRRGDEENVHRWERKAWEESEAKAWEESEAKAWEESEAWKGK